MCEISLDARYLPVHLAKMVASGSRFVQQPASDVPPGVNRGSMHEEKPISLRKMEEVGYSTPSQVNINNFSRN